MPNTAILAAIRKGLLKVVKRLVEGDEYDSNKTCELTEAAACYDHLHVLEYLHEQGFEWDRMVPQYAAKNGNLDMLEYAHQEGCEWWSGCCKLAAAGGYLECLQYAHENGCDWDEYAVVEAVVAGKTKCLRYLLENGCPRDRYALDYAARDGQVECAEICIEYGMKPGEETIEISSTEMMIYFYERGLIQPEWWDTNLLMDKATREGRLSSIQYGIENGYQYDCWHTERMIKQAAMLGHLHILHTLCGFVFEKGGLVKFEEIATYLYRYAYKIDMEDIVWRRLLFENLDQIRLDTTLFEMVISEKKKINQALVDLKGIVSKDVINHVIRQYL